MLELKIDDCKFTIFMDMVVLYEYFRW